mgnify:CR=1 FL=1
MGFSLSLFSAHLPGGLSRFEIPRISSVPVSSAGLVLPIHRLTHSLCAEALGKDRMKCLPAFRTLMGLVPRILPVNFSLLDFLRLLTAAAVHVDEGQFTH